MSPSEVLSAAMQKHQAGDLDGAEAAYRAILGVSPDSVDARHLLGVVAHQRGDHQSAVEWIQSAIALHPREASFHCNLGIALKALGQLERSVESYRRALELTPDYAEAHCNLGNALRSQGKLSEAECSLREALRLRPRFASALSGLGATLRRQGKALEAVVSCQEALRLSPNSFDALLNLGNALRDDGQVEEAISTFERAASVRPQEASVHNNLGNAYLDMGQVQAAVERYRKATALRPGYAEAHANLGAALRHTGDLDAACQSARRAIAIEPDHVEAHWNLAAFLLARGEFEEGWREYEWRWRLANVTRPSIEVPRWDGEATDGRILVHTEQGYGDAIQFSRFLPAVAERCGQVVFECPEPLISLFKGRIPAEIVPRGKALPECDAQCPLLSLPLILGTEVDSIPPVLAGLQADPDLVAQWKARLPKDGHLVGIGWQGSPTFAGDRWRSIPLRHFAPLGSVSNVHFVSLQKENGLDQVNELNFPVIDTSDGLTDFAATAALMANLKLIITSDTSLAHLAGSLRIPVWLALQVAPDWRWLRERSDSPWYPTMRLFRQRVFDDWPDVFSRIHAELESLLQQTA